MTSSRRLLAALTLATALLVPATAAPAAVPGINVTAITADGDPHEGWQRVSDSGARTVRSFADVGPRSKTPRASSRSGSSRQFADKAQARGLRTAARPGDRLGRRAVPSPPRVRRGRRPPRDPAQGQGRRLRDLERARRDHLLAQRPHPPPTRRCSRPPTRRQGGRPGRDGARRRSGRQRLRVLAAALRRGAGAPSTASPPHRHGLPDDRPARVLPRAERRASAATPSSATAGARDDARASATTSRSG